MSGMLHDIRYALRQMRKNPGFAASAVVVLALGIGATTGMLAIVQSVLLRPLEYRQPEKLLLLGTSKVRDEGDSYIATADFREMQRSLHNFEQVAAFNNLPAPVETEDGTQMMMAPEVSTNFFETLGIMPEMGRSFREGEGAPGAGAAIISHEFWQNEMHASKDVLGSKLKVNGQFYTVVGVMPPRFQFPVTNGKSVWTALQLTADQKTRQGFDRIKVLGRPQAGVTAEQARVEGEAFLRNRGSSSTAAEHFWVYPYQQLVTAESKPGLLALLAACAVLLLIAVVNAANLQIARASARQNEIAVRTALGASRGRIVRQTVIESLLLALAGAALGWGVATTFLAAARHLYAHQPRFDALRFDPWSLAACLLVTAVCGIAAAIAPSWHMLKNHQRLPAQGSGGRFSRQQGLSGWLVAAEVALSTMLLIAAGLFLRTFRSLEMAPLGFNPENVTTFLLWPEGGNSMPFSKKVATYERVLDRLEHTPGVQAAGLITSLPVSNFQMTITSGFKIPGFVSSDQKPAPSVRITAISPGYLRAMGVPIVAGRALSEGDTASSELVGIANQALARKYLRGVDPVGQQIVLDKDSGFGQPITIVGVAGDVIQGNEIGGAIEPELAVSFLQLPASGAVTQYMIGFSDSIAVRTSTGMSDIGGAIRTIVKNEAPDFAVDDVVPLERAVQNDLSTQRLSLTIASIFAGIAMFLSAAGLYAVLAYLVGQRIHEMGIRLALGAPRSNVFGLIVRQGLWMAGAGLFCGGIGALFAGRWIRSFLYGVSIGDPITYMLVGVTVAFASAVAILIPARRAATVDPMVALRYE